MGENFSILLFIDPELRKKDLPNDTSRPEMTCIFFPFEPIRNVAIIIRSKNDLYIQLGIVNQARSSR